MPTPLMPKATAVWLIDHTNLTFEQISEFTGLHKLEVQAIADGEVAIGIVGRDPVAGADITPEELKRCEEDPRARLKMSKTDLPQPVARAKGPRYTPVSKRAEKPDGIAYLIKNNPDLQDAQIARLLGTTKDTIAKVRNRSHWNSSNIKPHNPVLLGLCKQADLDAAIKRAERRVQRERKKAGLPEQEVVETQQDNDSFSPVTTADDASHSTVALHDSHGQEQPELDPNLIFRNLG
ncbi:MAG: DUF1013 domain-containing protein [Alphaproteobacteria bacterium]|nr:DUF1013 domain-containing protein [Alphaproteobacteria bacterium]MBV8549590.1 DUF1013 domain-containing protein [Alphaproteobacteria bacterium]